MSHPGRSDEQQSAEGLILDLLAKQTGLTYTSEKVVCGDEYVEIDGVGRDESGKVIELVEAYARQGKLKGGQLKKPTDDAARLMLARKQFSPRPSLRLAWCCPEAIGQIERGWRGLALKEMNVQLTQIELDDKTEVAIRAAQIRQKR
jgi:hypothetical protein